MKIEIEQEADGRWIAEIPDLPGVLCYGQSMPQAVARAKAWPCVSWLIDWSMRKRCSNWPMSSRCRREFVTLCRHRAVVWRAGCRYDLSRSER